MSTALIPAFTYGPDGRYWRHGNARPGKAGCVQDNFLNPFLDYLNTEKLNDNITPLASVVQGFDIINEPEWTVVHNYVDNQTQIRDFITFCTNAVRAKMPARI